MQVLADPRPRALAPRSVLHRVNYIELFPTSGILLSESNLWESLRCVEGTRTGEKSKALALRLPLLATDLPRAGDTKSFPRSTRGDVCRYFLTATYFEVESLTHAGGKEIILSQI